MAGSYLPGPICHDPFSPAIPARTSGILGRNDAGDPARLAKPGDTPGSIGHNDHAAMLADQSHLPQFPKQQIAELGTKKKIPVWKVAEALVYRSEVMAVDIDGAPHAYHPPTQSHPHGRGPGLALDDIRNATKNPKEEVNAKTKWVGVVVDKKTGQPVIQADGFYVSPTSLQYEKFPREDPRRYVDASTIPYLVLSPFLKGKVEFGDLAVIVLNRKQTKVAYAIIADGGPKHSLGEGSLALSYDLGLGRGGIENGDIVYVLFPGSGGGESNVRRGDPRTRDQIVLEAKELFYGWGGMARIKQVFPDSIKIKHG